MKALLIAMVFVSASVWSAEATPPNFDDLIKQLGSDSFDERSDAEEKLVAAGWVAIDALEHARDNSRDQEVRLRAKNAQVVIERNGGTMVDMALMWLAKNQEEDGHWDSRKHGSPADNDIEQTSLALLSFLGAGHTEKVGDHKEKVRKAVAWLKSKQNEKGLITREEDGKTLCIPHGLATMALAEACGMANVDETRVAAQKAIKAATSELQTKRDGQPHGFSTKLGDEADLFASTVFTLALKSAKVAGLAVDRKGFDGMILFLDRVDVKGEFARTPGAATTTVDSIDGLLCRMFLGWKKDDLAPGASKAIKNFLATAEKQPVDPFQDWVCRLVAFQQGGELWDNLQPARKNAVIKSVEPKDGTGSWAPMKSELSTGRVATTAMNTIALEVYYRYLQLQPDK